MTGNDVSEEPRETLDELKRRGFKAIGLDEVSSYKKTDYPIRSFKDILKIIK